MEARVSYKIRVEPIISSNESTIPSCFFFFILRKYEFNLFLYHVIVAEHSTGVFRSPYQLQFPNAFQPQNNAVVSTTGADARHEEEQHRSQGAAESSPAV